jgi:hypothetical protein
LASQRVGFRVTSYHQVSMRLLIVIAFAAGVLAGAVAFLIAG